MLTAQQTSDEFTVEYGSRPAAHRPVVTQHPRVGREDMYQ